MTDSEEYIINILLIHALLLQYITVNIVLATEYTDFYKKNDINVLSDSNLAPRCEVRYERVSIMSCHFCVTVRYIMSLVVYV